MPIDVKFRFAKFESSQAREFAGTLALIVQSGEDLPGLSEVIGPAVADSARRLVASRTYSKADTGTVTSIDFPPGMAAESILIVRLGSAPTTDELRKAGADLLRASENRNIYVMAAGLPARFVAQGSALAAYRFDRYKSRNEDEKGESQIVTLACDAPDSERIGFAELEPAIAGTSLARDLVNEPANVLGTEEFAKRLLALSDVGIDVTVLEETELEKIGMRALLAVGRGSSAPSKVAILEWKGRGGKKPFAMLGKGVVFDSGGISLKPASGMQDMTMDMAGAAVVAGAMKSIAMRQAAADVVGLIGLVENMPDGTAQRPGDIVRSLQGDTVEVINTDAEGRLVLADLLRYAQTRFDPSAMVDFATLTGAIITCLGNEMAGLFANSDSLADALLNAAESEGEKAWRLPLGDAYDKMLKSQIADMKNVGGRAAGSITAAQFLLRFVDAERQWAHFDIAGVARTSGKSRFAPAGATGWGVRMMDRFISERFEKS